ncbi:MAG: molybdate ABC transporter substrate-binding protein [Oscillospiraceae bacterium]|nr:molybdate ABC transporter substrate-binding protein [Oscillospiraceae bacterium]
MKKKVAFASVIALVLTLFSGCTAAEKGNTQTELIVFAAASMTETLTELGGKYMQANENVNIVFNFDSSGTLKKQIQEGAIADIFISAGQKQMDQLDIAASSQVNTDGLDFVLSGSRFDLLENKVALVVPEGNPSGITSFKGLKTTLEKGNILFATGNSDVPVGEYTKRIFAYCGLDEKAMASAGTITYGINVKDVISKISEAAVDCGAVYQTDAFSAGLTVVDTATAEMCGQVIYPAAILSTSKNTDAAKAFLNYLKSDVADQVFESVGFTPIA